MPKLAKRRLISTLFLGAVFAVVSVMWGRLRVRYDVYFARAAIERADAFRAMEWLTAAERRAPNDADVQYLLGVACRRAGKLSQAQPHFDRARELGWPASDLRRQSILAQFQAGKHAEVEPELRKMLESAPNDDAAVETYEALVKGYLADIRLKEAMVCLDYWLEWQPDCIEARILRADTLSIAGDTKSQEADLRYVLRLDPKRLDVGIRLGELLMSKNEIDAAFAQFANCHKHHPADPQTLLGLSHCEYRLGRSADAQQHADQALAAAENNNQRSFAFLTLGQIAIEKKDFQGAVGLLEKAIKLAPAEAPAYYSLGIALTKSGDRQRREEMMERYQQLDKLGTRLADLGEAALRTPGNAGIRYEAALALKELGDRHAALNWLLSALAVAPNHVEAHRALAEMYREDGQTALAERHSKLAERYSSITNVGP